MSALHRCHTCGTKYDCIARWCPGCGKRLGHRDSRGKDAVGIVEWRMIGFGHDTHYRCGNCGHITMDTPEARYCTMCGSKFTEFKDSDDVKRRKLVLRKAFERLQQRSSA